MAKRAAASKRGQQKSGRAKKVVARKHVADLILKELHTLARDDEQWGAKFKVLKESIEHHIQEEEGELFRIARAVLSRGELNDLGVRMKSLKAELEA